MNMEGWIKIHRSMLQWEWYDDNNVVRLFLHLLLTANYEAKSWHGITIERGQLISSVQNLAKQTGLSVQQIRTAINKLKSTHEITSEATNDFTRITICKYDKYQTMEDGEQQTNQQAEQQTSNKRITNEQQTNNNNIRNKEYKKERNNSIVVRFTPPTIDEVKAYCEERGNNVDAQRFIDFYSSKGWMVGKSKMKDWKAAVRTWEKTERPAPAQKYQETLNVNKFWNIKN